MRLIYWFLCSLGIHAWDYPGGHCEDCGACDEFLELHDCPRAILKPGGQP